MAFGPCSFRRLRPWLAAALLAGAGAMAHAGDIYVVAHPSLNLGADAIREIYIGEKQFAGEVKLLPLDNTAGQTDFLAKVLKLEASRYANLWVKKAFRDALNPPAVKNSDKEIIDIVRKTPGAIGYVTSAPPAGTNVILKQ